MENLKTIILTVVTTVLTICIKEWGPKVWQLYTNRYVEPKKAQMQVFLDQAAWFEDRAAKLAVFAFQLAREPHLDRFRLAEQVAKLDPHDRQWAMKQTDGEVLRVAATDKGAECHDNARLCGRMADEMANKVFW